MAFRGNGLNDIYDNDLEVKKRLTTKDGTIYTTPVNNLDIVNKAYCDSNSISLPISHTNASQITNVGTNTHAQIDTHIASTAIHFTAASIDHTAITNIGTNSHATIDTHISDTSDPHGTLLTQTYLNAASCAITADNTTVSVAFVRNIVFGTASTPPTASNFIRGALLVIYTP